MECIARFVENQDMKQLRAAADQLTQEHKTLLFIVGSSVKGNGVFVVKYGKKCTLNSLSAKVVMELILEESGGKGGGRQDMAQAGGCDPEKLSQAMATIIQKVQKEFQ
ncbi:hypothetical protein DID78_03370 [Candidatus Marinamargulisbacteria bacterium SCGC AG-343-D04]|nr:hypothetical protein DID78_03370 [Candidatus Marinamargulisbacteria bacterium SCGC AG-343-D04]